MTKKVEGRRPGTRLTISSGNAAPEVQPKADRNRIEINHTYEILKAHFQERKMIVHDCSMCGYPCGFVWESEQLFYDSGCWCLNEKLTEPRKKSDVLDFIKRNPELITELIEKEKICIN